MAIKLRFKLQMIQQTIAVPFFKSFFFWIWMEEKQWNLWLRFFICKLFNFGNTKHCGGQCFKSLMFKFYKLYLKFVTMFNGNWAFSQKHLGQIKPIDRCCIPTLSLNNWAVYGLSVLRMLWTVLLISSTASYYSKELPKSFRHPNSQPSGVKSNCNFLPFVTIVKAKEKNTKQLQC